ncbi:NADPH-dependent FMN reductase [Ornithinimicrobium cerasi]|uniref:NADPH-dependent FMN reductase n=1 Tax=Ornithinimicrobium cerasi TaxID=2248773 RepID=UPI000F009C0C|nr:NAD(P)H-dependent oxidoreductase [Ornithinimicrobium cerasi]
MKIGIVISTTRPSRIGHRVAGWIASQAPEGVTAEVVDLAEVALPFFADSAHPKLGRYTEPATIAWAERVSGYDAMIFTVAEYNGGYPAPLKNAIDALYPEWNDLPVGVVGYGWGGAGRAVTALRPVLENIKAVRVDGPALTFGTHLTPEGEFLTDARDLAVPALYADLAARVPARV